jgi:hypothetical protein
MTSPVNRYSYSARNLWLAYGLALFFSSIALGLGLWAFKENNASYDNTTSIILSLSRNEALDRLFPACCRGTFPQPTATMQAKVRIETCDGGTLMLVPESSEEGELPCDRAFRQWFLDTGLCRLLLKACPSVDLSMGWISPSPNAAIARRESSESIILVDYR